MASSGRQRMLPAPFNLPLRTGVSPDTSLDNDANHGGGGDTAQRMGWVMVASGAVVATKPGHGYGFGAAESILAGANRHRAKQRVVVGLEPGAWYGAFAFRVLACGVLEVSIEPFGSSLQAALSFIEARHGSPLVSSCLFFSRSKGPHKPPCFRIEPRSPPPTAHAKWQSVPCHGQGV